MKRPNLADKIEIAFCVAIIAVVITAFTLMAVLK